MTAYARRGALLLLGALFVFGLWSTSAQAATRPAQSGSVSKNEAIRQLDVVRGSIDRTLALSKAGQSEKAFAEAKAGYLSHFEYVEIPLRVVAPQLTSDAETKFAEIRGLISTGASEGEIRSSIVELRGLIDDAERHLTDTGIGAPAVVFGQSFLIIFREGLEAVLLVSVLLGYLEAAKATQYRRPIVWGMGVAALATLVTFFLLRTVLDALPVGREVLEAITALLAVAVLFYVSFWLIARLEQKRWLEFLRARVGGRVGRLDRGADARRLHRGVPRRLRDRAVLPSVAVFRTRPRDVGRGRPRCRGRRARDRGVGHLPARPAGAAQGVPVHGGDPADGDVGRVLGQRDPFAAGS